MKSVKVGTKIKEYKRKVVVTVLGQKDEPVENINVIPDYGGLLFENHFVISKDSAKRLAAFIRKKFPE